MKPPGGRALDRKTQGPRRTSPSRRHGKNVLCGQSSEGQSALSNTDEAEQWDQQRAAAPGDQMARISLTVHYVGGSVPATELEVLGTPPRAGGGQGGRRHRRCALAKARVCPLRICAFCRTHLVSQDQKFLRPDCAQTPGETRLPLRLSLGALWPWGSPSTSLRLRVSVCEAGRTPPARQGCARVRVLGGHSSRRQPATGRHLGGDGGAPSLLRWRQGWRCRPRACLTALLLYSCHFDLHPNQTSVFRSQCVNHGNRFNI